ncbi:MAG: hypothetical protein L6311_09775, partial [Cellulomonas sp.]|nr:hypothetical protein [Cellulomonas sp.]
GRVTYDVMRRTAPGYYRGEPVHVLSTTLTVGPQPDMGRSAVTAHRDLVSLRPTVDAPGARRV